MASELVWTTLPKTTLSKSSGFRPDWAMAAFAACTPRSVADWSFSAPPKVPNGVRLAARKTISVEMGFIVALRSRAAKHNQFLPAGRLRAADGLVVTWHILYDPTLSKEQSRVTYLIEK